MSRMSFVLFETLPSEQGGKHRVLPHCSENLEQEQQAEALSHSFTGQDSDPE